MNTSIKLSIIICLLSCQMKPAKNKNQESTTDITMDIHKNYEIAIFAGGCFWCTEAIFLELNGVIKVRSGYMGGTTKNPTYKEVCTGTTGHAEVIEITYDSTIISYHDLLEIFFATHDPTTLNRQGEDVGTQYRSEVFYHDERQKKMAEQIIATLNATEYHNKIVTAIAPATVFYEAEGYHQNYYNQNSQKPFCKLVISPKLDKLRKKYASKLKTN